MLTKYQAAVMRNAKSGVWDGTTAKAISRVTVGPDPDLLCLSSEQIQAGFGIAPDGRVSVPSMTGAQGNGMLSPR
ncbi:hypothetical protein [Thioclava sp. F28-4]|uniref:hypothetical protein n=1 Tax=Thioclava sp. F28-4 TaxID=1915315 RepID=UPI00143BE37D|nr:hypothetical protein [Thioclava sp. F28-4]